MRHLRYLPLTYLAGTHGFAMFAPYLVLCSAAILLLRRRRINRESAALAAGAA